jgi:hypothetical protein
MADADAIREAYFAARLIANRKQATYWAAGICGLLAVFIAYHWARQLASRASMPPSVKGPFSTVTR